MLELGVPPPCSRFSIIVGHGQSRMGIPALLDLRQETVFLIVGLDCDSQALYHQLDE